MGEFAFVIAGTLVVIGTWTTFCWIVDSISRRRDRKRNAEYAAFQTERLKAWVNESYGKHRK